MENWVEKIKGGTLKYFFVPMWMKRKVVSLLKAYHLRGKSINLTQKIIKLYCDLPLVCLHPNVYLLNKYSIFI